MSLSLMWSHNPTSQTDTDVSRVPKINLYAFSKCKFQCKKTHKQLPF